MAMTSNNGANGSLSLDQLELQTALGLIDNDAAALVRLYGRVDRLCKPLTHAAYYRKLLSRLD